jgi:2'-5' RNA ligase
LGVALLVPPPLDVEVAGLRRAVGDRARLRIPPHVTLVPPVNVREDRLGDVLAVLRGAAATTAPLALTLGPPATFLPATPVLHLGVGGEPPEFERLLALRAAVSSGPLDRPVTRPFVPHVTLADGAEPDRIAAAVRAFADFVVDVTFERVHLLEEGEGRVWHSVADVAFGPPAVVGRGGIELELTTSDQLDPEAAAFTERAWREATDEWADTAPGGGGGTGLAVTGRRGSVVVGTAEGRLDGGVATLRRLVVVRDERGTGIGTQLLAAFESAAAERGCRRARAIAPAGGREAGFLRSRGWVEELPLPDWEAGRDFLRLARRL